MQANPCKPQARNRLGRAFSLIELLAVMAIMSVLLAVGIPLLSNSSNNARLASREIIGAHLQQARAHAIATGTATAVAIPTLSSGVALGARAISLFEVGPSGNTYAPLNDSDGKQRMLQRWEILPGNFHFITGAQASSAKATIADSTEIMATEFKSVALTCHIIVFAPNGQIVRPATELNIATAQAARRGNTLTLTQKNGGKPTVDFLQVNRLTGRTRLLQP